jgi:hypothetical protein
MALRKGNKRTMIYKILHRKLNHGKSGSRGVGSSCSTGDTRHVTD